MKKKRSNFDNAYKYIFSNKKIFYQLIQSFVNEAFVKEIKEDDIQLVDRSFVSDEFLARETDLIYKIKHSDDDVYIYFLLEFQSTVDKSIPVRMLLYILQFYDLLLRNSRKGKLPSVFPILLYNGNADWTIPSNVKELIDIRIPEKYIPSFEYYQIIEKEIPDEVLLKIHNLASAMIYLEKRKDEEGVKDAIDQVVDLIKEEDIIDLRMFTNWFKRIFKKSVDDDKIDEINNLVEVKNMLASVADDIREKSYKKGIKQGVEKGIKQGVKETAKKLKLAGISADIIMQTTGLTEKEIEQL